MTKSTGTLVIDYGRQVQLLRILSSIFVCCPTLVRRWEYLKQYFIKLFIVSATVLHLYLRIFYSAEAVPVLYMAEVNQLAGFYQHVICCSMELSHVPGFLLLFLEG